MMGLSLNIGKAITDNKQDSNERVMDEVTKIFTKDDILTQIKKDKAFNMPNYLENESDSSS